MEELHAIVSGRVQGVGFRATVKYLANGLKLTGYARNLDDGTVEICAQGDKKNLELLMARLKEEFKSRIESVDSHLSPPSQPHTAFKIL